MEMPDWYKFNQEISIFTQGINFILQSMFVLFEHASGYAIFKVIAKEEIGALLPEVQESVLDLERFGKVVKLVAFSPFKSAVNALENLNNISEGKQLLFCISIFSSVRASIHLVYYLSDLSKN